METKTKLRWLQCASFLSTLTPLAIAVGINWDTYTKTTSSTISITIGGVIAIIMTLLAVKGHLKAPAQRIWTYVFIFVMACLLEPIIMDIKLLSGMLLAGEGINLACFDRFVKKTAQEVEQERIANTTNNAVKQAMQELKGENNGSTGNVE